MNTLWCIDTRCNFHMIIYAIFPMLARDDTVHASIFIYTTGRSQSKSQFIYARRIYNVCMYVSIYIYIYTHKTFEESALELFLSILISQAGRHDKILEIRLLLSYANAENDQQLYYNNNNYYYLTS